MYYLHESAPNFCNTYSIYKNTFLINTYNKITLFCFFVYVKICKIPTISIIYIIFWELIFFLKKKIKYLLSFSF